MSLVWDATTAKAQFRLASQRLRQLQDKKDAQGFVVRKDIATLLRQGNAWLARSKAQGLLVEEAFADLLERVERHIGVLLEHLNELDLKSSLSPEVVEAVATIIHVAPHIESRDLHISRNILVNHLGPNFLSSALDNRVSPIVIRALAFSAPSISEINACLRRIALSSNVTWEPDPLRHDAIRSLSEMLNESSSTIDISQLRKSCCHGIPDEPVWLRPRVWRLLLGITPAELCKRRNDYYDLVRRLLNPFTAPDTPSTLLSSLDVTLVDISKQLSRIPSALFLYLDRAPDIPNLCPLNDDAPDDIRIPYANSLELRLAVLQGEQKHGSVVTPEIRIEGHDLSEDMGDGINAKDAHAKYTTILPSNAYRLPGVHPRHSSALLRILYLHATINPGVLSPHVPSLLIPLYAVLTQEVEPEHSAHVEADAFWLFETMLGEFVDFEDEQAVTTWLHKFGERVAWADKGLFDFLHERGLDPALPHYSYRWLTTLLTHTLPLPAVVVVWDVLFSRPMRMRSSNYKMDHLLDICAAMLLCLRSKLLWLGRGTHPRLLWSEQVTTRTPEFNDAFMEGMALLQNYPIEAANGVDLILQTALDLLRRRSDASADTKTEKVGLGMRIRDTMWRGFTNQLTSPVESPEPSDDDSESSQGENNETGPLSSNKFPSFTSRLATTVWKGVTNQTAMEPPPSPPTPLSPVTESPLEVPSEDQRPPNVYNGIWNYAERLKDSDAIATLSKVSSNWKARALVATVGYPAAHQRSQVETRNSVMMKTDDQDPLNGTHRVPAEPLVYPRRSSVYSPPPRPVYFRSPRDSYTSSDTDKPSLSYVNVQPTRSSSNLGTISRTRASLAALISPPPKSAPRPLILSSSSVITRTPAYNNNMTPRHPHSAPAQSHHDWTDDQRVKKPERRDSLSSVSSLSTSESVNQSQRASVLSRDSDTSGTGRRILLNRKSVSPLAPKYRSHPTLSSKASSSSVPSDNPQRPREDLECADVPGCIPGSPSVTSPLVPHTPSSIATSMDIGVHVTEHEERRGSVLLEGLEGQVLVTSPQPKKFIRKRVFTEPDDTTDSSIVSLPARSLRARTRRHQAPPASLRLQAEVPTLDTTDRIPSPNALRVEWPIEDQDMSTTPRASEFGLTRRRSASPKIIHKLPTEIRIRKVSGGQPSRKTSLESRETQRNSRDSAAEEGDDEGYDDLLSAYESEESSTVQLVDEV